MYCKCKNVLCQRVLRNIAVRIRFIGKLQFRFLAILDQGFQLFFGSKARLMVNFEATVQVNSKYQSIVRFTQYLFFK